MDDYPLVQAWADALLDDPAVSGSVPDNFFTEFTANMHRRGLYVAQLMPEVSAG